jgi:hypothetical protein
VTILVIDGQGGRLGAQLVRAAAERLPQAELVCVGTNALATGAMLKAGAARGATGENAVLVACRRADVILGPIGIVIADALMGEVTPAMAAAVGQADAERILLPMNRCGTLIAGVRDQNAAALLGDAMDKLAALAV